ncbi:MAG: hypothetical protein HY238_06090 [Acidobacteria bacterium]|nr:hypothetical protein [Acidobacteriota bacterium]
MDTRFLWVISLFTGMAAVALLVQTFLLLALYLSMKKLQERLLTLADRLDPILDSTRHILQETRQSAREIFAKLSEITETTRVQVIRIDGLMSEVSAHTKANLDRIDRVAEDAAVRVEETVAQVQRTILAPVRGIHGAAAAVRAVVGHLARRHGASGPATQEEDLFI